VNKPLDELYLGWLYRNIGDPDIARPARTFWNLANHLYTKEFVWFIPNDDNRIEDGRYLREEFIEDLGLDDVDPDWIGLGCSMLELLIGLSRRLSFLDEGEPSDWFWHLIDNLGLRFSDRGKFPVGLVEEVLNTVIWRTYKRNGSGGLFPLKHADRDQRDVEIWFQMSSYLLERT
jgi:hypothetical protein